MYAFRSFRVISLNGSVVVGACSAAAASRASSLRVFNSCLKNRESKKIGYLLVSTFSHSIP